MIIVLLSLNQGTMTLWGFAVSWYLEIFALAAALFLLDRVSLGWLGVAGAMAVTVAGAFSSLEGLLIWPVGLLLLYQRRRSRAMILAWITRPWSPPASTCSISISPTAGTGPSPSS